MAQTIAQIDQRYQAALQKVAVAQAKYDHAVQVAGEAEAALTAAGFESVDAARAWADQAGEQIEENCKRLDTLLADQGY